MLDQSRRSSHSVFYMWVVLGLLAIVWSNLSVQPVLAQPAEPAQNGDVIRLPEVVITGIERLKIQRIFPKVTSESGAFVVLESAYDRSEAFTVKGDRLASDQLRQIEQEYTQAVAQDSTNSAAYVRLGDVSRALNKAAEAEKAYQQALTLAPNLAEAHYKLGLLYETQLRDINKAIEHYRAYLAQGGVDQRVNIWLRDAERRAGGTTP